MPLPATIANNLTPLGALFPVAPAPSPPLGGAGATAGARSGSLAFTMRSQEQLNWCWSAVAVSVAEFHDAATTWNSQCDLASTELGETCCPAGVNKSDCDQPWYLDRSLTRVGHYDTYQTGSLGMTGIQTEIDATRPLGVRIEWPGGTAHFVVISGYATSPAADDFVTVEDSINGQSTLKLSTFESSYQGSGTWSHTYFTK